VRAPESCGAAISCAAHPVHYSRYPFSYHSIDKTDVSHCKIAINLSYVLRLRAGLEGGEDPRAKTAGTSRNGGKLRLEPCRASAVNDSAGHEELGVTHDSSVADLHQIHELGRHHLPGNLGVDVNPPVHGGARTVDHSG
jgi:hypothetical protein